MIENEEVVRMREIKFRAWDKKQVWMLYKDESCGHTEYEMHPIQAINKILAGEDKNLIFMQYTGLKDRNGTEIYEGDILNCRTLIIKTMKWSELQEVIEDIIQVYYFINYDELEVIGNIYENPELLGGAGE